MRHRRRIWLERPIEEVFAYVSDPENDPEWCPPVIETIAVSAAPPAQGQRYHLVVKPGPKRVEGGFELTEFEAPFRMSWRGSNDLAEFSGTYRLETAEGGCVLEQESELIPTGFAKLLTPIVSVATSKTMKRQFANLKQRLESERT